MIVSYVPDTILKFTVTIIIIITITIINTSIALTKCQVMF